MQALTEWPSGPLSGVPGDCGGREAGTGPVPKSATATTATAIHFNSMPIFDSSSLGFL